MKKQLFFLFSFLFSFSFYAQYTLTINGEEVTEDKTYTYTTLSSFSSTESEIEFKVTNTSDENIFVNLLVEDITNNNNGNNVQFCWGQCYAIISENSVYPTNGIPELAPGESTAEHGNHFKNMYEGDDTDTPVSYIFRFRQVDSSGTEIGNPIRITYIYDGTAGVNDNLLKNVSVYPTLVENGVLSINTDELVYLKIYDSLGKVLLSKTLEGIEHSLNLEHLNQGFYFVELRNANEQFKISKILINK